MPPPPDKRRRRGGVVTHPSKLPRHPRCGKYPPNPLDSCAPCPPLPSRPISHVLPPSEAAVEGAAQDALKRPHQVVPAGGATGPVRAPRREVLVELVPRGALPLGRGGEPGVPEGVQLLRAGKTRAPAGRTNHATSVGVRCARALREREHLRYLIHINEGMTRAGLAAFAPCPHVGPTKTSLFSCQLEGARRWLKIFLSPPSSRRP